MDGPVPNSLYRIEYFMSVGKKASDCASVVAIHIPDFWDVNEEGIN
jgi:hypothetical protein